MFAVGVGGFVWRSGLSMQQQQQQQRHSPLLPRGTESGSEVELRVLRSVSRAWTAWWRVARGGGMLAEAAATF